MKCCAYNRFGRMFVRTLVPDRVASLECLVRTIALADCLYALRFLSGQTLSLFAVLYWDQGNSKEKTRKKIELTCDIPMTTMAV